VIAVDSTGIKVSNRGEWMREKWRVHRGWIKVLLAVNVETKEIAEIEVTDERVSDGSKFNSLIDLAEENLSGQKIEKVLSDRAFVRREILNYLQGKQIHPVIKTSSSANAKARRSPAGAKAVWEMKELGYQRWKESTTMGRRWAVKIGYLANYIITPIWQQWSQDMIYPADLSL